LDGGANSDEGNVFGMWFQHPTQVGHKGAVMSTLFSHYVVASRRDVVGQETQWRHTDESKQHDIDQVVFTRWSLQEGMPPDVSHPGHCTRYCVAIALDATSLAFRHDSKQLWTGPLQRGGSQITSPNIVTSATFLDRADVLHAYIPSSYIEEVYRDCLGKGLPRSWALDDPRMFHDDLFWCLGTALIGYQNRYSAVDSPFLSGLGLAMVARLIASRFGTKGQQTQRIQDLPRWRLQRVVDYIHQHLAEQITLSELASVVGLTRMHFAAQFRKSTGVRPHEYVTRLRVERARSLLLDPNVAIIDVAVACGFQSQAHFTTVFKRFVGTTPHRWRVEARGIGEQARRVVSVQG
jgi:AraC family transcriptional regulator